MDDALVDNAGDAALQQVLGRQERDRERQVRHAIRVVLGTKDGRLLLHTLLQRGNLREHGFIPDHNEMYFRAGRRDFARQIEEALENVDPDSCERMRKEARERVAQDELEADTLRASGAAAREKESSV